MQQDVSSGRDDTNDIIKRRSVRRGHFGGADGTVFAAAAL